MTSMTVIDNLQKIKGPKSYYNIYEKAGQNDSNLYNTKSIWGNASNNNGNAMGSTKRSDFPVYTQFGFNKNTGQPKQNLNSEESVQGFK